MRSCSLVLGSESLHDVGKQSDLSQSVDWLGDARSSEVVLRARYAHAHQQERPSVLSVQETGVISVFSTWNCPLSFHRWNVYSIPFDRSALPGKTPHRRFFR